MLINVIELIYDPKMFDEFSLILPIEETFEYFNVESIEELQEHIEKRKKAKKFNRILWDIKRRTTNNLIDYPFKIEIPELINQNQLTLFDIPGSKIEVKVGDNASDLIERIEIISGLSAKEIEKLGSDFDLTYGGGETASVNITEFEIEQPEEIVECDETNLKLFKELADKYGMYRTPFDENPTDYYFAHYYFWDCYKGEYYSKDFQYKICPECDRYICEQNPANGWVTQFRSLPEDDDEYMEPLCNRCIEQMIFKGEFSTLEVFGKKISKSDEKRYTDRVVNIIDLDGDEQTWLAHDRIKFPALFMNDSELEENGFTQYKSIFVNSGYHVNLVNKWGLESIKDGLDVVIQIDSSGMGLEYDITLWTRKKEGKEGA